MTLSEQQFIRRPVKQNRTARSFGGAPNLMRRSNTFRIISFRASILFILTAATYLRFYDFPQPLFRAVFVKSVFFLYANDDKYDILFFKI